LARIPVRQNASEDLFRRRIAMRPVDLILGAIETQSNIELPGRRDASLATEEWSWLFQSIRQDVHRRHRNAPLVDSLGRPTSFLFHPETEYENVRVGDVLVAEDQYALLEQDDGDGWLGEGDSVLHTIHGKVLRGKISELPGKTLSILRPRSFLQLREDLRRAGYNFARRSMPQLDPDVINVLREFQRSQSLPATGIPDAVTLQKLQEFLAASPDSSRSPSP
jgi:hypothetical protein